MSRDADHSEHADNSGQIYRGPANWFSLRIPSGMNAREHDGLLELTPEISGTSSAGVEGRRRRPDWAFSLYSAWVGDDEPQISPDSVSPETLFPGVLRCRQEESPDMAARCQTWQGLSLRSTSSWWKKLFERRNTYHWRLWIIEYQQIVVVASLQVVPGQPLSKDAISLCEQMLASMKFADNPALPPELFRKRVVQLAQATFPLLDIDATGAFGVRINDSEIHLTNFYRSYLASPEQLREIVLPGLTTVVRLQEWGPDQLMPELSAAADRIMPMLYPEDDADGSLEDFVQVPWVAGLRIMFVLDEDDTYRFVHRQMLEIWDLTVDELQELAMKNLAAYTKEHPLEVSLVGEEGAPQMLIPVNPGAYNSSRLLGQDLHLRLRQVLGTELLVGVPNRDFFVAVSLDFPELIGEIRRQVAHDFESMHHPLTSRMLVISADGVSEYCEP